MELSKELLTNFLVEAHRATYANPKSTRLTQPYRPGCEEYSYTSGDWGYLDSYAWKDSGGGEEIIYFRGKPVWLMNYYGFVIETDNTKVIYSFLRRALGEKHPDLPVRGNYLKDHLLDLRYEVEFKRKDIGRFRGAEYIYQDASLAYECFFHGGFVG